MRAALVLWGLLFAAAWLISVSADGDLLWLAPGFFLPQFSFVAGLASYRDQRPWPWVSFLASALPAAASVGLGALLAAGSVLEALGAAGRQVSVIVLLAAGLGSTAVLALALFLRRRPRRTAALSLLFAVCAVAGLQAAVSVIALPFALRQGDFLAGLVCHLSLAMAATTLVWTVPGWITALLLPAMVPADEGRSR